MVYPSPKSYYICAGTSVGIGMGIGASFSTGFIPVFCRFFISHLRII